MNAIDLSRPKLLGEAIEKRSPHIETVVALVDMCAFELDGVLPCEGMRPAAHQWAAYGMTLRAVV